ncbi:MAG: Cysteine protease atg4 [Chaenotheca gracillima]|nr:MAG: Cysteine protease atg4 [Chaenotheca gracillima]
MAAVDMGKYKRIVQYFWDPEPKNDDPSHAPIWCLGEQYIATTPPSRPPPPPESDSFAIIPPASSIPTPTKERTRLADSHSSVESITPPNDSLSSSVDDGLAYSSESSGPPDDDGGWPTPFLDDFEARLWFTYRSNFPPIAKSSDPGASSAMTFSVRLRSQLVDHGGFTSDSGWGCMIRSGQSLLGNALSMIKLGRDWRRGKLPEEEKQLLSLFADDPSAPFSIHRFVEHGATACGKHPGEWFGPSATARCIQALCNDRQENDLRVYITGDGSDVYEDSFMKIARPEGSDTFHPTLVLVGTRLGIDRVTPVYWESLKASLQLPQSVGIAGGRPSSSHYFTAVQSSHIFYLDPHQTRPALPSSSLTAEDISSCHTRRLRRLHIREMDPSMLIAFLIRDEADWRSWRAAVEEHSSGGKPVIRIADREPSRGAPGAGGAAGREAEREGALDEVEILSDDDDDDDGTVTVAAG